MMKKINYVSLILSFILTLGLSTQTGRASFLEAGTETTQVAHTGVNAGGWINDAAQWAEDRVTDLNKLTELITNNVFTEAIRGFNELMTAIQTDISEVLGTVQTLAAVPGEIWGSVNGLFTDLMSLPMSIMSQVQGLGGGFNGMYADAMSTFSMIGSAQGLGQGMGSYGSLLSGGGGGGGFSSAYDLKNRVSGLRTAVNANFLEPTQAQKRSDMYRKWTTDTQAGKFGNDSVQIQATQADMLGALNQSVNRDAEFAAMDRLQEAADRISAWEQSRARAAGSYNRTLSYVGSTVY
jgi:hypothetical protein